MEREKSQIKTKRMNKINYTKQENITEAIRYVNWNANKRRLCVKPLKFYRSVGFVRSVERNCIYMQNMYETLIWLQHKSE